MWPALGPSSPLLRERHEISIRTTIGNIKPFQLSKSSSKSHSVNRFGTFDIYAQDSKAPIDFEAQNSFPLTPSSLFTFVVITSLCLPPISRLHPYKSIRGSHQCEIFTMHGCTGAPGPGNSLIFSTQTQRVTSLT